MCKVDPKRKLVLKTLCFEVFKNKIKEIPLESMTDVLGRKNEEKKQLVRGWKKYRRTNDVSFAEYCYLKQKKKRDSSYLFQYFQKEECFESFPGWILFLPEMMRVYDIDEMEKYECECDNDLDKRLGYVISKDNGIVFERVFMQYFKNEPKTSLENSFETEKAMLFDLYYKTIDDANMSRQLVVAISSILSGKQPIEKIVFPDTVFCFGDEPISCCEDLFHRILLKRVCELNIFLKNYDEVIEKQLMKARNKWLAHMITRRSEQIEQILGKQAKIKC